MEQQGFWNFEIHHKNWRQRNLLARLDEMIL